MKKNSRTPKEKLRKSFHSNEKSKNDTKKKIETAALESVVLLKEVANNDTSKKKMDKSREHELKLIQMLNFTESAPHQQQHSFQSMPNQVIDCKSIAQLQSKPMA